MKNKTLFNYLFFTFSLLGSFFVLDKPLNAEEAGVCPDPEETTISSVYNVFDEEDTNSFYGLTGGFCRGTPETYGVTVQNLITVLVLGLMKIQVEKLPILALEEVLIYLKLIHQRQH